MAENSNTIKVTVIESNTKCDLKYNVGDTFYFNGYITPEKPLCSGSYVSIFPLVFGLQYGAKYPFANKENSIFISCPDNGYVKFKIEKME